MRAAAFSIDYLEGVAFEGFTRGETWNGFACPYFTREQASRLLGVFVESGGTGWYDEITDSFFFAFDPGSPDDLDEFRSEVVDGSKVYPVGTSCWAWSEVPALIARSRASVEG